jgi:hypothetical protein
MTTEDRSERTHFKMAQGKEITTLNSKLLQTLDLHPEQLPGRLKCLMWVFSIIFDMYRDASQW